MAACAGTQRPEKFGAEADIVSLSPSVTQVLLDLGCGQRILASDSASLSLAREHGFDVVDAEAPANVSGIVRRSPAIVFVDAHTADVALLRALAGTASTTMRIAPQTTLDVLEAIRTIANIVGKPEAGAHLARETMRRMAALSAAVLYENRPAVALIVAVEPLTTLPGDHYATELIEVPGGNTVLENLSGSEPTLTATELLAREPDVIIDASREHWDNRARTTATRYWRRLGWNGRIVFVAAGKFRSWGDMPGVVELIQRQLFPARRR